MFNLRRVCKILAESLAFRRILIGLAVGIFLLVFHEKLLSIGKTILQFIFAGLFLFWVYGIVTLYINSYKKFGVISLSSQILAHRRTLFYVFVFTILIDILKVPVGFSNIIEYLESDNGYLLRGLLAFVSIYLLVEYLYNLFYDAITSISEYDKSSKDGSISGILERPGSYFIIGNLRFIFDIVAPVLAVVYVFAIYWGDCFLFMHYVIGNVSSVFRNVIAEF